MAVQLRRCLVPAVARPFRLLALQQREEGIAPIVGAGHRRADHLHRPGVGRELRTRPDARSLRLRRPIRCGPYVAQAGIKDDREGPLFRPLRPDGLGLRGGTSTARPPGGWSRNIARRPGSTPSGWAAAASASTRCARRRSTQQLSHQFAEAHPLESTEEPLGRDGEYVRRPDDLCGIQRGM